MPRKIRAIPKRKAAPKLEPTDRLTFPDRHYRNIAADPVNLARAVVADVLSDVHSLVATLTGDTLDDYGCFAQEVATFARRAALARECVEAVGYAAYSRASDSVAKIGNLVAPSSHELVLRLAAKLAGATLRLRTDKPGEGGIFTHWLLVPPAEIARQVAARHDATREGFRRDFGFINSASIAELRAMVNREADRAAPPTPPPSMLEPMSKVEALRRLSGNRRESSSRALGTRYPHIRYTKVTGRNLIRIHADSLTATELALLTRRVQS